MARTAGDAMHQDTAIAAAAYLRSTMQHATRVLAEKAASWSLGARSTRAATLASHPGAQGGVCAA